MKKILLIILFVTSNIFANDFTTGMTTGMLLQSSTSSPKERFLKEVQAVLINEEACIQQNKNLKPIFSDLKIAVRDDVAKTLANKILKVCSEAKTYLDEKEKNRKYFLIKVFSSIALIVLIIVVGSMKVFGLKQKRRK